MNQPQSAPVNEPARTAEDGMMVYANIAGYLVAAVVRLVLGTLFGSKLTTAIMSMMHGLEARIATIEGAVHAGKAAAADGAALHAAAIGAHAAAVTELADAIGKHAAAVDEHGAATVAAAVEAHAGTIAAGK
jgi:hypothetical protein